MVIGVLIDIVMSNKNAAWPYRNQNRRGVASFIIGRFWGLGSGLEQIGSGVTFVH